MTKRDPRTGSLLDRIRASKATVAGTRATPPSREELLAAALAGGRPRMVFAIDGTASREDAWSTAQDVTDALFAAVPGVLDVALAVHGGGELHTFSGFSANAAAIRRAAADVTCRAGGTRLVEILERVRDEPRVKVLLYIGDAFEEFEEDAVAAAQDLARAGTRCIILQDGDDEYAESVFGMIAELTGGALLPFDGTAVGRLRDLLRAVATLAAGGVKLLEARQKALPGARQLLENLRR
jgi:hypothetical protein